MCASDSTCIESGHVSGFLITLRRSPDTSAVSKNVLLLGILVRVHGQLEHHLRAQNVFPGLLCRSGSWYAIRRYIAGARIDDHNFIYQEWVYVRRLVSFLGMILIKRRSPFC